MTTRSRWIASAAVLGLAALFVVLRPDTRDAPLGPLGAGEKMQMPAISAGNGARQASSSPSPAEGDAATVSATGTAPQSLPQPRPNAEPDRRNLTSATPLDAPPSPVSEFAHFDFTVTNHRVTDAPKTLRVQRGQVVRIRILADRDDTLHLHGYDHKLKLTAGQQRELTFRADTAGRFGIELHHPELELGSLEVFP